MLFVLFRMFVRFVLALRYRIRVIGYDKIIAGGKKGILFLPNHPALIDPVIMTAMLWRFRPRAVVDINQVRTTVLKHLQGMLRFFTLENAGIGGQATLDQINEQFGKCIQALRDGDNVLLYPAGHLCRSKYEKLHGASGTARILHEYPEVRVVLVRTKGLWGSDFGHAKGYQGSFGSLMRSHFKHILLNGIFFSPRRNVTIELVDMPADFPRSAEKDVINRSLEAFYNQDVLPNTYVPYTWFERGGTRILPEPEQLNVGENTENVPAEIKTAIIEKLRQITSKKEIKETDTLGTALGLDSLIISEIQAWLQDKFGCAIDNPDSLKTVASLMLAAIGESTGIQPIIPIPKEWFIAPDNSALEMASGTKVTELLLENAKRTPDSPLLADQAKGVLTFRKLLLGIMALRPSIEKLEGERIGIIMPASLAASLAYFATLFAGKVPVMLNWTVGLRNLKHCVESTGVERIITARVVIEGLQGKGTAFTGLHSKFAYLEDIAEDMSVFTKISALLRSKFCWSSLRKAAVPDQCAIIFTSGSESLPKAVPLTHSNMLSDLAFALKRVYLHKDDCLLGMLPPFHSFGLLLNVILPAATGLRIAYHANPLEGDMIARLISAYKVTMAVATPTFVANFLRNASIEQVTSLKWAITGAEKCSELVINLLKAKTPQIITLEGYGITECGPIVALCDADHPRFGTIGKVLECMEHVLVKDDLSTEVAIGETGLLLVRGPNIFSGYLNYDGPSPFVQFDGKEWYNTGDLLSEDEHGYLTFRGRLKRFIKLGGEMVSLPAIEEALASEFTNPDPKAKGPALAVEALGKDMNIEIVLFTVLKGLDREKVNQHLRLKGFASSSYIRQIIELPEIPLLGSGKTDYRTLKAQYSETAK